MLARLLQRYLLALAFAGSGLAVLWHGASGDVMLGALLLPWLAVVSSIGYTMLKSRAPAEPAPLFYRAWWGETVAAFLSFVLRQPWAGKQSTVLPAHTGSHGVPVLLVHGYVCNHRLWDEVIPRLRHEGHAVLAVDLEPLFVSIDHYADAIEASVQALLTHSGQSQVALVGHSMGGLAIRAWMRQHGSERVARILTLGTPHAGTQAARHSRTPNGRQMRWDSAWLHGLAESESAEQRALMRIALSPQDNIVFPQRAQTLPGVTPVVFEGLGHIQMCHAREVIDWVAAELNKLPAAA
nr:alpha/beta fold hydrolase [uncultured Rhodoferax sp.]